LLDAGRRGAAVMSRKLMTILLSSTLVFANVSTPAWSATGASGAAQTSTGQPSDPVKNEAPLPPAGAAGIKQAQGLSDYPGLTIAVAIGVIALIWILVDDDGEDSGAATGTFP
jgi:hypothetical protein